MTRMADLLRDAAEEQHFDWKQDPEREAKKKRNPRTKLVRNMRGHTSKSKSKMKNLRLDKIDWAVLEAVEKERAHVFRSVTDSKKRFKQNNPEIKFVSGAQAARYLMLEKDDQSFGAFQEINPARVTIVPTGNHFVATYKPEGSDEARTFSTQNLGTIVLKHDGSVVIRPAKTKLENNETKIPPHIYAAWKVDGEHRNIPLADYLTIKSARIKTKIDRDAGTFRIQHRDTKSTLIDEKTWERHAGFYQRDGQLHHLEKESYSSEDVNGSLVKFIGASLLALENPNEPLSLSNVRLTPKGIEFLNKRRAPEQQVPLEDKKEWAALEPIDWSVLRALDEKRDLEQILEPYQDSLAGLNDSSNAMKSKSGAPYVFRNDQATRSLFLSRPGEDHKAFKDRSPDRAFTFTREGDVLVGRHLESGRELELEPGFIYFWNPTKDKVERTNDPWSAESFRKVNPKAAIADRLLPNQHRAPENIRDQIFAISDYYDYRVTWNWSEDRHQITFTNNINDKSLTYSDFTTFYLNVNGAISPWQKKILNPERVKASLDRLEQSGLIRKEHDAWLLEEKGLSMLGRGVEKTRARYEFEMKLIRKTGEALGFVPEIIMDKDFAPQIRKDSAKDYRQKTMVTHTGKSIPMLVARGKAPPKRRELGHEVILAAGVKKAYKHLLVTGATDIRYIPENELRSAQTKAIQQTGAPFTMDEESLNHMDPKAQINGLPDGVFIYKDHEGHEKGLAIEADSGGSTLSNSRGYDEPVLAMKDDWSKARGMDMVYVVQTNERAQIMCGKGRTIWVMDRFL